MNLGNFQTIHRTCTPNSLDQQWHVLVWPWHSRGSFRACLSCCFLARIRYHASPHSLSFLEPGLPCYNFGAFQTSKSSECFCKVDAYSALSVLGALLVFIVSSLIMTAFFVDWDLWQEMTFVLGCCIVLVFAMGLVKLWWSNRAIRRLEIIDEEKRARISLMSRCGIENMRPPEIPFGVRAILSGVEVEGIWISRPNSPGPCQLTPVATQVGRRIRISKGKGKMIEIGSSECLSDTLDSETSPSYPTSTKTKTSQQDGIASIEVIQCQQEHVSSASSMTKTQVDSIVRRNSQINCNRTGSRSPSSCNDDFITPEQTPPGSTVSQTEAFEKGKGHSVSDTIFSIEQLNALPHVRKPSTGSMAMPSGHPRVLRSEKRRLISESSSS